MNYLFGFIVFTCVVFVYIHIVQQYKRSEDLEIYEMDYNNNTHLQEICDIKQPVIFEVESILPSVFENGTLEYMNNKYGTEILNIKDSNDYYKDNNNSVDSIPMKCTNAYKVFQNDSTSHYYTENNSWFLEETDIIGKIKAVDEYLKPTMTVSSKYDYITGSDNTTTPLRYHFDYRHYYVITSGKIHVKMTPWKSCKYLRPIKDYENYEFRSTYNAWTNPPDDIRWIEFDVSKGDVLYIPPYWWYSIQFTLNTSIYAITYNSLMNVVAYSPQWVLYFIQQQNIFKKEAKTTTPEQKEDEQIVDKITEVIDQVPEQEPSIGV
jgi:hypothetical protein